VTSSKSEGSRQAKYREKQVRLREAYTPMATVTLLTRVIRIFHPHHELYGVNSKKEAEMHQLSYENANDLNSTKASV
jgi:hypothetical protein